MFSGLSWFREGGRFQTLSRYARVLAQQIDLAGHGFPYITILTALFRRHCQRTWESGDGSFFSYPGQREYEKFERCQTGASKAIKRQWIWLLKDQSTVQQSTSLLFSTSGRLSSVQSFQTTSLPNQTIMLFSRFVSFVAFTAAVGGVAIASPAAEKRDAASVQNIVDDLQSKVNSILPQISKWSLLVRD